MLKLFPASELGIFSRGAAQLAGLFAGLPVLRVENGWMLPFPAVPVVVTEACSATSYWLMVAALVGWQWSRGGKHPVLGMLVGLAAACPITLAVNALRVICVTHAHRWISPQLPAAYDASVHLFAGMAVFLPSLIALNLLLQIYGSRPSFAPRS
jgi:exosortase/archaeosortase family protein